MATSPRYGQSTVYSDVVPGVAGNHDQSVRFDYQDGFVGIVKFDGGSVTDRVLLSPGQVRALYRFLKDQRGYV